MPDADGELAFERTGRSENRGLTLGPMGIKGRRDVGGEKKICLGSKDVRHSQIAIAFRSLSIYVSRLSWSLPKSLRLQNKIGQRKAISQEQITHASKTTQQMPEKFAYSRIQAERS